MARNNTKNNSSKTVNIVVDINITDIFICTFFNPEKIFSTELLT